MPHRSSVSATAAAFSTTAAVLLLAAGLAAAETGSNQPDAKARGSKLVHDMCTSCHEFHRVEIQHFSRAEWQGVIKGMISEGGPVTDEEMSLILDYLAASFGQQPGPQPGPNEKN